MVLQW